MKPQDHKAKKPVVKDVDGGKQVTFPSIYARSSDGKIVERDGNKVALTVMIGAEALDDFELLDEMRQIDDGNASRMPAMLERLVGGEYRSVLEALRDRESGRVKVSDVAAWIHSLFFAIAPN